jgi:hypothetical protein
VKGWKGQFDLRDPMFELDRDTVKVTPAGLKPKDEKT